jgi:hypothetical protein
LNEGVPVRRQPERPTLITDAARSPAEQLRSRQIRYVTMMTIRAGCLVTGAVLISARVPLLSVWLILCAVAMILLPWMAVLVANDRPARSRAERAAAATRHAAAPRALGEAGHPTIDVDS